ncbi:hypothetical protein KIPB_014162, partial [Kipferlia bialata]|eukprot:g14162.t1
MYGQRALRPQSAVDTLAKMASRRRVRPSLSARRPVSARPSGSRRDLLSRPGSAATGASSRPQSAVVYRGTVGGGSGDRPISARGTFHRRTTDPSQMAADVCGAISMGYIQP